MILVSFSFAEDALSNDVKNDIFNSQGTEKSAVPLLGGTPGIYICKQYKQRNKWIKLRDYTVKQWDHYCIS